jgi:hypothetical protein
MVAYTDLEAKLAHWQGKVNRERGMAPRAATITLGGPNA